MFVCRALLLLLLACLCACGEKAGVAETSAPGAAIELRVMSFNIEWGGTHVSFDKVVEAIRLANADIVGIQEAEGNLARLASELGWFYDRRNYVISRYPLLEPPGADGRFLFVEVMPGRVVAIANVHLPSDPDGMAAVRDGASPEEVLEIERNVRLPRITPTLDALSPLLETGIPSFVTGDFNAPAHTDWTTATVGARPFLPYALDWPVSLAMHGAGFKDAWREVYPDPLAHPGLTWWAARPPLELYAPGENDPQDRIDFIWFAGELVVHSIELAGEAGAPEVTISVTPWPSDHRAVIAQFSAVPAAMPALLTTDRRIYREGDDVHVRHHGLDRPGNRLAVIAGSRRVAEQGVDRIGRQVFPSELFEPGVYRIRVDDGSSRTIAEKEFWVLVEDAVPAVSVDKNSYEPGETILVEWRNAPGNRNDYLAVYPAEEVTAYGGELAWTYVNALPGGMLGLDQNSVETGWPLAPGNYRIHLMKDDGYQSLAESGPFHVRTVSQDRQ